jgi:hypothetical protein
MGGAAVSGVPISGALIGTSSSLWLDFGAMGLAMVAGISASSLLLARLARWPARAGAP